MKLLDSARNGDVVIAWKLDRAARSVRQIIETTVLLNERGVELHSFNENINTTPPSGKLTFHIFAAWPSGVDTTSESRWARRSSWLLVCRIRPGIAPT